MTKKEFREKKAAIVASLANAEGAEREKLQAELQQLREDFHEETLMLEREKVEREQTVKKTAGEYLREVLKGVRDSKQEREITLGTVSAKGQILDSGAVTLTIHDIIPTLNEGLGLPLSVVTGVTGDELWPVSVDDAEVEEVGETAQLTDQDINFDNIKPVSHRGGISIVVSNTAIDNADFDLLGFIQTKFTLAVKKYLAKKLYSQAAWTGNKGPFSGLASKGTITLANGDAYAKILKAVAEFTDKGFDAAKVCLIMDAVTEAELKATPKAAGQGGFIIENGKCAGYDYIVSHYINTTLDTDGKTLKATADKYIGIGYFDYEAVQQHGQVRLTLDATSKAVAVKNVTAIVFNSAWSFTDLSVKLNKKGGTTTQAFALYKLA